MIEATLKDGFGIEMTFGATGGAAFTLVTDFTSITPPGITGGDPIDTTTHSNEEYRTKHSRALKEITDSTLTVVYDPGNTDDINAMINVNGQITFNFPPAGSLGDELVVWGYLKDFKPNAFVEGEQATAECTIVFTCENDSGVETGPVASAG